MPTVNVHIGTSGWHYSHWKNNFYPPALPEKKQLSFYSEHCHTVEINNSFYKLPSPAVFEAWKKMSSPGFIFSVKVSRYITHARKLNIDRPGMQMFWDAVVHLGRKLGPCLLQLPPRWKVNTERLSSFLTSLPKNHRYAIEFRDHSWYCEAVYAILRKHNVSFCIYHLDGHLSPLVKTANFVYVRLHGPGAKYQGSYSRAALAKWASQCKAWMQEGLSVYLYFDNDQAGYAVQNAISLQELIKAAKA